MVPRGVDDRNELGVQAMYLLEQETFGLKREPLIVEEVPRDQQRIHSLGERQIDQPPEGQARCVPQFLADRLRPARARRVQMYVGRMKKAHQLPGRVERVPRMVERGIGAPS